MITIGDLILDCDLSDIIDELQAQMTINYIPLLQKRRNIPTHIMIQCPYHKDGQERKPSAGIRKTDGLFHCFSCGEVHSLPEVISQCFGEDEYSSFGWKWLLKNFASVEIDDRSDIDLDFARGSDNSDSDEWSIRDSGTDNFISDKELDKYRYIHPYLYKRGMTDEIIELFDLGYDSATKTITFPVKDIHGNCLFIARRSVSVKYYNYPEGVKKPLYGLYELHTLKRMPDEIVVCEGMFDCLTFWVNKIPAVALNGLGSSLQIKQLKELPVRKIILALDNDKWGSKAKKRIKKNLRNKLITQYILPNEIKDINELYTVNRFDELEEVF